MKNNMANFIETIRSIFKNKETIAWEKSKSGNTKTDYIKFLSDFPKGDFASQAKTILHAIEEDETWEVAKKVHQIGSYENYLNRYKNGRYQRDAEALIEQIRESQRKSKEEERRAQEKREKEERERIEKIQREKAENERKQKEAQEREVETIKNLIVKISKNEESDWDLAYEAAQEVGKFGKKALSYLIEELSDISKSLRHRKLLVFAIGETGDISALECLARLSLSNTDDKILKEKYLKLLGLKYEDELLGLAIEVNDAFKKLGLSINDAINLVERYADKGNEYIETKKYNLALEAYDKFISLTPFNPHAYFGRGTAKHYVGDQEGACADWAHSVELGYEDALELINKFCKKTTYPCFIFISHSLSAKAQTQEFLMKNAARYLKGKYSLQTDGEGFALLEKLQKEGLEFSIVHGVPSMDIITGKVDVDFILPTAERDIPELKGRKHDTTLIQDCVKNSGMIGFTAFY